jgi:hypothetical protein
MTRRYVPRGESDYQRRRLWDAQAEVRALKSVLLEISACDSLEKAHALAREVFGEAPQNQ